MSVVPILAMDNVRGFIVTTGNTKFGGLDGIVVAETELSMVDGDVGELIIGGYDVEHIAGRLTFEDLVGLLLERRIIDSVRREDIRRDLAKARVEVYSRLATFDAALSMADGMEALRAGLALLSSSDPLAVLAAVPVLASQWHRRATKQTATAPDPSLSHAADYLAMTTGRKPKPAETAALDAYLVTVSDHGMNASTFTARVVASTGSDLVSSIVGALGALKGPLHGGAPGPVLDMLDAIGAPVNAEAWIEAELAAGRRIMGMGHRIYRVRDPRAAVLERMTGLLEQSGITSERLALARAVETAATGVLKRRHPTRPLLANVEFYTAVLLDTLGLPRTLFSPTFAIGRAVGWCAHIDEQRRTGRLIRPESRYVGVKNASFSAGA